MPGVSELLIIDASRPSWALRFKRAFADIGEALRHPETWMALAWQDLRQRYRRSLLGPFWITLTMLVTIVSMGTLYGILFQQDLHDFMPYLALGIISWGLIASLVVDGCNVFTQSDRLIRSVRLPMTVYVAKSVYGNLLTFLHNILAFVPVLLYFSILPQWRWLAAIPGVLMILLAAVPVDFILGILCARFRDLQPIVNSIMQLMFFLTPIFWKPESLGARAHYVHFNPLYLFVDVVRGPIYGYLPDAKTYLGAGVVIVLLYAVALPLFARYRARIAFWV